MSIRNWKEIESTMLEKAFIDFKCNNFNVKYPCYGGALKWRLFRRKFYYCYFFLTDDSIIVLRRLYSQSYTEIPYEKIKKISIKRRFIRSQYKIKITANKKYTFILYTVDGFEAPHIGSLSENVERFLSALSSRFGLNDLKK